jgi:hypothetical protein
MRNPSAALILIATLVGCATATPPTRSVQVGAPDGQASAIVPPASTPLPFKGRLIEGDPGDLPPAVVTALAPDAELSFAYHENLTHDEYHIPLVLSAFDPGTYVGAPLGDYAVTAFASLTITRGDTVLGNYTAKVRVAKSYSIYSEPTHREVEEAARAEVRARIDERLYSDANRVAALIAAPAPVATNGAVEGVPSR